MAWNGTPVPTTLDYALYVSLGGSVPEAEFDRYLALAREVLRRVTFGRDTSAHVDAVNTALTLTVNALATMGGFTGETLGSYSYTKPATGQRDVDAVCADALSTTGLTYRGISWNTAQ